MVLCCAHVLGVSAVHGPDHDLSRLMCMNFNQFCAFNTPHEHDIFTFLTVMLSRSRARLIHILSHEIYIPRTLFNHVPEYDKIILCHASYNTPDHDYITILNAICSHSGISHIVLKNVILTRSRSRILFQSTRKCPRGVT